MVWCVLCMCTHCDECAADAQAPTRACELCVVRGRGACACCVSHALVWLTGISIGSCQYGMEYYRAARDAIVTVTYGISVPPPRL